MVGVPAILLGLVGVLTRTWLEGVDGGYHDCCWCLSLDVYASNDRLTRRIFMVEKT